MGEKLAPSDGRAGNIQLCRFISQMHGDLLDKTTIHFSFFSPLKISM